MKQLRLKESQSIQLELMKEIHMVCKENKIKYYLIAGSCLGAVRHKGFIPWDDDIDIGMRRLDYEKFAEIFDEKMNTKKYFLQNYRTDPNVHFALSRVCIKGTYYYNERTKDKDINHCAYIDLFPLDNVPNSLFFRWLQHTIYYILHLIIASHTLRFKKKLSKIFFGIVKMMTCIVPLRKFQEMRDKTMSRYKNKEVNSVCSLASKYNYKKQTMPIAFYGIPKLMQFEDSEFNCPTLASDYLTHLYGSDFMKLPQESKRVKPHPIYLVEDESF